MASANRQTLSADGTTTFAIYTGPVWVSITGGFGGGTAKVQRLSNASPQAAVDISDTSTTEAKDYFIEFPKGSRNHLAVNIASSTTPTLAVEIVETG